MSFPRFGVDKLSLGTFALCFPAAAAACGFAGDGGIINAGVDDDGIDDSEGSAGFGFPVEGRGGGGGDDDGGRVRG